MQLTEEQIERIVERRTNALDKAFISGAFTKDEYREALADIDAWAEAQFAALSLLDTRDTH